LNVLCLGISIAWVIHSKFDFEPILVTVGFVIALLTTIFLKEHNPNKEKTNSIIIKNGKNNKVEMDVNNRFSKSTKDNSVEIHSDDNDVTVDKNN